MVLVMSYHHSTVLETSYILYMEFERFALGYDCSPNSGDNLLEIREICPRNGTAFLKGSRGTISSTHPRSFFNHTCLSLAKSLPGTWYQVYVIYKIKKQQL